MALHNFMVGFLLKTNDKTKSEMWTGTKSLTVVPSYHCKARCTMRYNYQEKNLFLKRRSHNYVHMCSTLLHCAQNAIRNVKTRKANISCRYYFCTTLYWQSEDAEWQSFIRLRAIPLSLYRAYLTLYIVHMGLNASETRLPFSCKAE
jgi:hypothetical protein